MTTLLRRIALGVLFFSIAGIPLRAAADTTIPLLIDNPTGLDEAWPLTCGVPFAKGKLKDTSSLWVEAANGKKVPCQIDTTATWLDGSVRWVLVNFQGRPDKSYSLKHAQGASAPKVRGGIVVKEEAGRIIINTGRAEFVIRRDAALISEASMSGTVLLRNGGQGAYVIDNRGREARLGGPFSKMSTRFLLRGPLCTVVRKEGWYVVPKSGLRPARGIVWMYFYGNSPCVKIVHRLVLTKDTNRTWFKDIGVDFPTALQSGATATFDTARAFDRKATTVRLKKGETAWMLQDDFPHFMSKRSHFSVVHKTGAGQKAVKSGAACGDWCSLSSQEGGLTVVLRDLAEQFPKELTASPQKITAHLWAGRCGRELDFRTKALVKEYWGEWTKYADVGVKGVLTIPSNAQASAKTHTLWLLPHAAGTQTGKIIKIANAASKRILALPDPKWTCETGTLGSPMHPRDAKRFPKAEAYISDFFDRLVAPNKHFPLTGYIAWGANPCTRYGRDEKTGKTFAVWWRISGLVDYHLRRNAWTLYARSGERKYFEYGEHFNRFAGDMNMHHWDYGKAGDFRTRNFKVKGSLGAGLGPVKQKLKGGEGPGSYPIYWRWYSSKPGGSGADIFNYLHHFYLTGDWDIWELADNFAQAIKKHPFLQTTTAGRGAFLPLRYTVAAYSMNWDKQLGKMVRDLAHTIIDLSSPNAVNVKMPPYPMYKISRNAVAMLDYMRLIEGDHVKKGFLKMIDYQYRFERGNYQRPVAYQNACGMYYTMAWRLTGEEKYLRIANLSLINALKEWKAPLKKKPAAGADKAARPKYWTQCLNYHACLSMPVILKAIAEHKRALPPFPMLKKFQDSTANAWAVFEKKADQAVMLEMLVRPSQATDVKPVLLGPDLKPISDVQIVKKERQWGSGAQPWHMKVEVPAHLPAGTYRIGQENTGAFTVLDANVDHMVMECPDGFWIEKSTPFYFRVPAGLTTVKLFASMPVNVKRSDGRDARYRSGRQCGEMALPVQGKPGFWELSCQDPAFVRLRNLPAFVSCMTPEYFFVPQKRLPVAAEKKPRLPDPRASFVKGVIGRGLQLNLRDRLKFERGGKLPDGTWENFPGLKGTIEFYYRPNWSALDTVMANRHDRTRPIFSAGTFSLRYRYGHPTRAFANMNFLCGRTRYKARGRYGKFGNSARIYPEAGRWYHIAATWDAVDTVANLTHRQYKKKYNRNSEHFHVFINGKRHLRSQSFPASLKMYVGKRYATNYTLEAISELVTIQPSNGTVDELRLSDTVRYTEDFVPSKTPFTHDEHTKALFHFDGSTAGAGGDGKPIKVEYKDMRPRPSAATYPRGRRRN